MCDILHPTTRFLDRLARRVCDLLRQLSRLLLEGAPLRVAGLHSAPFVAAMGFVPKLLHLARDRAKFRLGFSVEPRGTDFLHLGAAHVAGIACALRPTLRLGTLHLQRAMIDPLVMAGTVQLGIDVGSPTRPPPVKHVGGIPAAVLRSKPLAGQLAGGQHDVRVRLLAAITGAAVMDREVCDHAPRYELGCNELTHHLDMLFGGQLILDTLARSETIFPHPAYAIGFRKGWIFEAPFDTWPISLSLEEAWGPQQDEGLEDELRAFTAKFFPASPEGPAE